MSTRIAGRYQLVREIGSGGMGRVFQALDIETGNSVAAKILIGSEEIDLQSLIRFTNEGAVLSTLKHPNIVQVYGTHLEEHTSCIIMELLEGQSLRQILQNERLSLARVKHLMRQVASALAFAHSRAIVHRDVKPDNIMVVGDDHVKVTDFGIARVLQERSTFNTKTGSTLGTPLYMSPEQIEGHKVDGRSDIYSFGAVLYQMVAGRPPFEGRDPLTIAFQHVHKAPQSPGTINAELPDDWEAVILTCLAKNPDRRFQTVVSLEEALASLAETNDPLLRRQETRSEPEIAKPEPESPFLDQEARTLHQQGASKEITGDLRGALRDYRAASSVAATAPLQTEIDKAIRRVTEQVAAAHPAGPPTTNQTAVPSTSSPADGTPLTNQGQQSAVTAAVEPARGPAVRSSLVRDWRVLGAVALVCAAIVAIVIFLVHGQTSNTVTPTATPVRSTTIPLTSTFRPVATWTNVGSPGGLAVNGAGNIYVADYHNNRIVKLSPTGHLIAEGGSKGSGPGKFNGPSGVVVDSQGHIYVADSFNNRIDRFSSAGSFEWSRTLPPPRGDPVDVAVDGQDNVYVADIGRDRILKLSPSGKFVAGTGSSGSGRGQYTSPNGVSVDGQGNIYVADTGNNRIVKLSPSARVLAIWGKSGSGPGQFSGPIGVAVDGQGYVYVADTGNNRIVRLSPSGRFLNSWGSKGSGSGQLNGPRRAVVDGQGNIYVADYGNNRVVKFTGAQ